MGTSCLVHVNARPGMSVVNVLLQKSENLHWVISSH